MSFVFSIFQMNISICRFRSWSSLLSLYGTRSIQAQKLKKEKESEVTALQVKGKGVSSASGGVYPSPSQAILDKLKLEMKKLAEQKKQNPDHVVGKLGLNPLKTNPAIITSQ